MTPHLVSVSTCYVAGNRRGAAPEALVSDGPFDLGVDWRERGGRRPPGPHRRRGPEPHAGACWPRFRKGARRELGAAGTPALAAKTEQLRERWVADRMVDAGRARAVSLGWPDAYAYTKALGEQALMREPGRRAGHRSCGRRSSSRRWPSPGPGWIRGFRMAEPVIISYARGLLKEFPGVPEGTVDVIPVDLVVGAVCAVAALGPERGAAPSPRSRRARSTR